MCFGFNKVQAIDSVFDETSLTRNNLQSVAASNSLRNTNTSTTLVISKTRRTGNYYSWGNNTTVDAKNVWKIANYSSGNTDYSNLYYCLNAERGFGTSQGRMTEGATDQYTTEYEVNDTNKNNIISIAGGSLGTNYNKILWILDNSYVPTGNNTSLSQFKSSMESKGVSITHLTEEQIEVVQQMAIWYYTNNSYEDPTENRGELPNLYYNGNQSSNIVLTVDDYGERITLYDELNDLYKYYIRNASSSYNHKVPTLSLSNVQATVTESGDYIIAGPFSLSGTNTDLITQINATITPNKSYTLLNSSKNVVSGNNFTNVIGSNFYLRFNKSDISSDTTFNLKLNYKYNIRNLTVLTDITDVSDTQPVVLLEQGERSQEIETNINIELKGKLKIVKTSEGQTTPDATEFTIAGPNGYSTTVRYANFNHKSEKYHLIENLPLGTYTVTENTETAGTTGYTLVVTGDNGASRSVTNNNTTTFSITNTYTSEKISKTVTKEWVDNNNQDGLRNSYKVTITGKAGNTTVYTDTQTLSKDTLTYTWNNLPKYQGSTEIVYTVDETQVPTGYTKSVNGFTITNTHIPEVVSKTVTKEWVDNNNQDGLRNSYKVTITGKAGNTTVYTDTQTLSKDTLTYTWNNLPKYQGSTEIVYTVDETQVPEGYIKNVNGFTITNTHVPFISDLALRKYITSVDGTVIEQTDSRYRVPNISDTNKLNGNDANDHTASYKHQKEPIVVNKNSEVIYNITIYNEGKEVDARATQIIDQLPDGLVFDSVVSGDYTGEYNSTTHRLILTKTGTNNIAKYSGSGDPSSETVQVKCIVTAEATSQRQVLTNIAWISGMMDEKGNTQNDIDSRTDDIDYNKNDTEGYTGKENKDDLSDKNCYYKGQQDDDDFDKVVIEPKEEPVNPDLALRKFITNINGRNYDREPQIGAWTLDNGSTVTKTHTKEALTVETGDIVTYTIRVYNEGNVKGKATKVTDYLPAGLKLVENNTINNENGWVKGTTANGYTAITTEHLKNTDIAAYSGRGEPSHVDLKIVCEVIAEAEDNSKNLKNIAEITQATYERGTSDIDSTPKNVNNISVTYDQNPVTGKGEEDDDDFEWLVMEPKKPEFDLSLRKFITNVNESTINREPQVDTSTIATTGTARYVHTKDPISVQVGDIVTYKIRVYNEGETDGYVAKITDHLPEWLDFISEDTVNQKYLWNIDNNRTISTEIAAKDSATGEEIYSQRPSKQLLKAYDGGDTLDYIDVEIRCRVNENAPTSRLLTNIAEISKMQEPNGTEIITDRDSTKANVNLPSDEDLPDYTRPNENGYFPGQEDDDDFEKVIVKNFDLALRKFITQIGDIEYDRVPVVDTSKLGTLDENGKEITTAIYNHPKNPLNVKKGDIITYTLRIYNEGTLSGYATEVFDYIPEGLEFIDNSQSSINQTYGWEVRDGKIVTTYLADKLINGVTEESESKILDYKDVKVQLKVTADPKEFAGEIITNWAEIGEDSNNDIDSTPGNNIKTEDDIDFEPVKLTYFDLALRKFITNANGIEYNNRIPEVDTSKLGTLDENGKKITTFTYNHTKDPVVVTTGSTVIYTIRVYNEGSISGYATELTDNIPEGLQFLPENETNTEYKWKMLDENGNVTQDATKAKKITTAFLANEIIDSYQKENGVELLSYKDVKVAFKVIEPNTSNRLVINTAEISKASDEDIDSIPGNNDLTEDDIDREYLKVKYFDLALKKWVTEARVTYNGKTTVTKTGFNEDSTEMAKVDLVSKRLNKTTVKFVYKIKVINEGEVAGYATEVEDYIPAGLKFVEGDNPKWKLIKDDVAVTDQLKDTLLEPGQSATIEIVLTWKNSTSNMGVKTNWAEIKEDSDDDVDSVPDNYKKEEDDIDNAKVILSIKTGSIRTYIFLSLISITILAGGTFAIKKYVLN